MVWTSKNRFGVDLSACVLCLLSTAAAAGELEHLGIRVEIGGPAVVLAAAAELSRPAEALTDGRPALGGPGCGRDIAEAWLTEPTGRYGHRVLGDAIEAGALLAVLGDGRRLTYRLPADSVFEDLAPRLADLDGDGRDEIVVVRSYLDAGAALAVLGVADGRLRIVAETPPIGRPNRWLNPVGAGDFDGDGRAEVAYVETPHIGGTLRIWRLEGRRLVQVGRLDGFSNHAIGSRALGLSAVLDLDGDGAAELLIPDAARRALRLIGFAGGRFRELGRLRHRSDIAGDVTVRDLDGNGAADVAYRLADGRWVRLLR